MSLLTIVQQAMGLCNQPSPTSAFGNTDPTVQQFVAFAQDEGDEIINRYTWKQLNTPGTITGNSSTTLWPIPSDFSQLSLGLKFFSSLYPLLPLYGPITNEDLAALKALPTQPIRPVWRFIGSNIELWPAVATGEVITYNYYSTNWIQQASGGVSNIWSADTDTARFSELMLRSACVWRWKASKGLDYAEDFRKFEKRLVRANGRDDTGRVISTTREPNLGEDVWPGTITDLTGDSWGR